MDSIICLHDCAHCGFEQEIKFTIKIWPKNQLSSDHECIVCERKYRIRLTKYSTGKIGWRTTKINS